MNSKNQGPARAIIAVGQTFNQLVVLSEVAAKKAKKGWKRYVSCLCLNCRQDKVIAWEHVKSGRNKTCGCGIGAGAANTAKQLLSNISGNSFHEWKVLGGCVKARRTIVTVQCRCGTIRTVPFRHIASGHSKSCGCEGAPLFQSQVDGKSYPGNCTKNGYIRISIREEGKPTCRTLFHVNEAKKVYNAIGKPYPAGGQVHHIDNDTANNQLSNLSVLSNSGVHLKHHRSMEKAMYSFIRERGLLDEFYQANPPLKLLTLQDCLTE